MARLKIKGLWWVWVVLAVAVASCNSPYPESEEGENILYTTFAEEPKHLDPAQAYSTDEAALMTPIIEPPFEYHFLKRPHVLVPQTATEVPTKATRRKVVFAGKTFDARVYTVRIKQGIHYQDHPCFVPGNMKLTDKDVRGVRQVWDIKPHATRELVADDYLYGIRRLADPRLACPIFATLAGNMLGMQEYQDALQAALDEERERRKKSAGMLYNREGDEKYNPIPLDYAEGADDYPFIRKVDKYTFEIVLKGPYPQILYWMAMAFFAPIPPEAVEFFNQRVMLERGIILDKNPVGTGPYVLREFDPTNQIVLERNKNYRHDPYPTLPEPDPKDKQAVANYKMMKAEGMLLDAGKPLPLIDRIVMRMEKEAIPRWNKFRQGYYDSSGIVSDVFDKAITLTSRGDPKLTDDLARRGIRLLTSTPTTVSFYAFNMLDPVFGAKAGESGRKLRQAISIAFDVEEEISIFYNGRGIAAQSPLPPGIFGREEGEEGINPIVYRWDPRRKRGVRRSLDEAKKLLAEAGYPGGYDKNGEPLSIRFATRRDTPDAKAQLDFVGKQFKKLNIRLVIEASDYNRFRDKVLKGNYQFLRWGWVADYPDAENFLFLLYGPNGKVVSGGENTPNYDNEEYNRLFLKMESMENSPERLEIIRKMITILREDSPWIFGIHPLGYGLYHKWYHNAVPHGMAFNTIKFRRIDPVARTEYRKKYNQPRVWPVVIFLVCLVVASIPAVRVAARHFREA